MSKGKDTHDRSQLTIMEASQPWGPWKVAYRTDDWRGPDGSSGAYTPVIVPGWLQPVNKQEKTAEVWMSFTQVCTAQRVYVIHCTTCIFAACAH